MSKENKKKVGIHMISLFLKRSASFFTTIKMSKEKKKVKVCSHCGEENPTLLPILGLSKEDSKKVGQCNDCGYVVRK